ncbi:uncharacterized protein LOC113304972 [Papaver somniferum]|uniref:uncharacterized protein LOC113304972 n=1 Tax=Papaver somniferum TaxID=3469 RepID=UPI000E6FEB47|nr:uncharacterized protein LOC113304972 [Papaver somniferum]
MEGGNDAQSDEEEAKEPEWFQNFVEEHKFNFEKEEQEPQFPEDEEVDPSMMLVGTRFAKQEDFKRNLRAFCVLNETQFLVKASCSRRVKALCRFHEEYKFPWFVFCSRRKKGGYWSITSLEEKHTCAGDPFRRNKSANKYFVCDWVKDRLKSIAGKVIPKPGQIAEDFFTQTNFNIPYQTAWKERNLVLESLYGNYEESFNNVPTFCNMVTKTNEDFVAIYTYAQVDDRFESMTIYFASSLQGFKYGCREVIGLDACHLTGKHGGVLMAATTLDTQNGLVPLGIMICRAETIENWTPFLQHSAPHITDHKCPITLISDRKKGLMKLCLRRLEKLLIDIFIGNENMKLLKNENEEAFKYLMRENPELWSRAFLIAQANVNI